MTIGYNPMYRREGRSTSPDFKTWTKAEQVLGFGRIVTLEKESPIILVNMA